MTPGYILVVAKHRDDVFAALFFDGLPAALRARIRILEFGNDALDGALAGAAAVIVMRHGLFSFGRLAPAAGWAGVPRYYFLDDNLMLLQHEPEAYGPYWSDYTPAAVRTALRGFEGVLLASAPLQRYFAEHALHACTIDYPPMAWPILRRPENHDTPFRIAFFGGEHRRDIFARVVYPAVQRLATEREVEVILVGIEPGRMGETASSLRLVHLPYEIKYGAALESLARHRPDVLVHPTPPSRNNEYRNANVLINARAVGAAAVLSNVPPYDTLGTPPPAVLCDNDPDSWHRALSQLAGAPQLRHDLWQRASEFCDVHFSGRPNVQAVQRILDTHAAPGGLARVGRRLIAGPPLGLDRAIVRAKDLARRSAVLRSAAGVRHRLA